MKRMNSIKENAVFAVLLGAAVLFLSVQLKAQKVEFREIAQEFFDNKTYSAEGEMLLYKRKKIRHIGQLTGFRKSRLKWKAKRDRNVDRERTIVIYVDTVGLMDDGKRTMYVVWGNEK
jgi:hypothetical protein